MANKNPGLNPSTTLQLAASIPSLVTNSFAVSDYSYAIANGGPALLHVNQTGSTITSDDLGAISPGSSDNFTCDGSVWVWSTSAGSCTVNTPSATAPDARYPRSRVPGANLQTGLANWFNSLGLTRKTSAGTGQGGVDIVWGWGGDSILEGGRAASYLWDRTSFLVMKALQDALNPAGVQGGPGLVRAISGKADGTSDGTWLNSGSTNANRDVFTLSGTGNADWTRNDGSNVSGLGGLLAISVQAGAQARYEFDGTASDAVAKRNQITGFDILVSSTNGNMTVDRFGVTGFGTSGAGSATAAIGGTTPVSAIRTGSGVPFITGLTKTALNNVQFSAGGSGRNLEGVIGYCDDYDCGVRLHNVSNWGTDTTTWKGGSAAANIQLATLDRFCAGGAGSKNGKLVVMDLALNDCGTGATSTVPLATFQTRVAAMVDAALAQPTLPSVLYVIPPMRSGDAALLARTTDRYSDYVAAIYAIAATRPGMAVLDLYTYCGGDNPTLVAAQGWNAADNVHLTDTFQMWLRAELVSLLLGAYA